MVFRLSFTRLRLLLAAAIWLISLVWFASQVPQWWQEGRLLAQFPYEPLLVFLSGFFPFIDIGREDPEEAIRYDFSTAQHQQNRENVIANVKTAYIDGVLRNALHKKVRIELQLQDMPQALQRPMLLYEGQTYQQPLEHGASINDIFLNSGRALLILGAPGAGKTITLLELCRVLLDQASQSAEQPVPVVINLSTWAERKETLSDWIIYEMNRQYQLSTRVSPAWLAQDHLCLLLDGLDEVRGDARQECLQAINYFKEAHDAPLVVCSRIKDYQQLSQQLNLSRAVTIQPLDKDQVKAYLNHTRLNLSAVYEAVEQDDALAELSRTPLMLDIMTVAYRGYTSEQLQPLLQEEEERRRHLYNAYIKRVMARRPSADSSYQPRQALHWLRFLARQLTQRSETQFFIEDLQPDWLPPKDLKRYRIISFLIFGIGFGLYAAAVSGKSLGKYWGFIIGVITTLFVGSGYALGGGETKGQKGIRRWTGTDKLEITDELKWRKPKPVDLLTSLLIGIAAVFFSNLIYGLQLGPTEGVIFIILFILQFTLKAVESGRRTKPTQGIYRAFVNSLFVTVIFSLLAGFAFGFVFTLRGGLILGFIIGLAFGLLMYGGDTIIRHLLLRGLLHHYNLLPLRIVSFLDSMAERILVQQAGAHYRFVHRTLQEHIADLSDEEIESLIPAM